MIDLQMQQARHINTVCLYDKLIFSIPTGFNFSHCIQIFFGM